MELIRLAIVYIHLIACCVAIGLVFTSDIDMVKQLLKGDSAPPVDQHQLDSLQKTVSWALVVLWVTGLTFITWDVAVKGWGYFANPKIQAKIGLVLLLTLNGVALHHRVLPLLKKAGSLARLSFDQRLLTLFVGAVSAVTWFYAAFIGVGRALAWKYSLVELLAAYPVLIAGAFFGMLALTQWAKSRRGEDAQAGRGAPVSAL